MTMPYLNSFRLVVAAVASVLLLEHPAQAFSLNTNVARPISARTSETRLWAIRREPIKMPTQTPMVPYKVRRLHYAVASMPSRDSVCSCAYPRNVQYECASKMCFYVSTIKIDNSSGTWI